MKMLIIMRKIIVVAINGELILVFGDILMRVIQYNDL